jgi:hypothetical protein
LVLNLDRIINCFYKLSQNQRELEKCVACTKHNLSSTDLPYFAPNFEHVVVIYPSGNIPENLRDFEYIGMPEEVIFSNEWKHTIQKL